jgi:hypothetical protein
MEAGGHRAGDVISYMEMCSAIGVNLQRGMNFHLREGYSVILMSRRTGAPYADRIENDGRVLIYEAHDIPRTAGSPDPKQFDQPRLNPSGSPTQNGMFADAAKNYREGRNAPELVKVYEKIHAGIWVYNGLFTLVDCWEEQAGSRMVFKFKLELADTTESGSSEVRSAHDEDDRIVPSWVKLEVWKRDKGRCTKCGSSAGLHFDHVIPYSKADRQRIPRIFRSCVRATISTRETRSNSQSDWHFALFEEWDYNSRGLPKHST